MHFFLILTNSCNLKCRYCMGKECSSYFENSLNEKYDIDYEIPDRIEYKLADLKKFLEKDHDPTVILYGGEPLLEMNMIKEVIGNVKARFMLQTNGLLLKELGDYALQLHNVMFSLDGVKRVTDNNRGAGVYDKIIENVKWLRSKGFKGEILARMTATGINDMNRDVKHLLKIFDSVHWQLDSQFFPDYDEEKFESWMKKYNKELEQLLNWWISEMKKGVVHRMYPFVGVMQSFLKNEKKLLRCGAGHSQYAIAENGDIYACPVIAGIKDFRVGTIFKDSPDKLAKISLSEPCSACSILDECGGRCLYANKTRLWGEEGFNQVCENIKLFLTLMHRIQPNVEELIKKDVIKLEDFDYDEFNSCEIIP